MSVLIRGNGKRRDIGIREKKVLRTLECEVLEEIMKEEENCENGK